MLQVMRQQGYTIGGARLQLTNEKDDDIVAPLAAAVADIKNDTVQRLIEDLEQLLIILRK